MTVNGDGPLRKKGAIVYCAAGRGAAQDQPAHEPVDQLGYVLPARREVPIGADIVLAALPRHHLRLVELAGATENVDHQFRVRKYALA
ncbi:hypothetical protein BST29_22185 [Mycobacterium malmoense]|uniref:Uncharacterized protein n=1 Tax=Mycobacterium malmoense TaxID=1780 RepID=A0ABX3SND4_MYCMA|nr:hypothetical protein BST29_22185 [Mycobacterium malmoense]